MSITLIWYPEMLALCWPCAMAPDASANAPLVARDAMIFCMCLGFSH